MHITLLRQEFRSKVNIFTFKGGVFNRRGESALAWRGSWSVEFHSEAGEITPDYKDQKIETENTKT